jgi:hypothetical protein
MKTIRFTLALLSIVVLLSNCGKKNDPGPVPPTPKTEAELRAAILTGGTGTWTPSSSNPITVNGLEVSELFQGFTISFTGTGTGGTYTTTGTTPVWARSGTWTFVGDDGLKFTREDNLEVSISDITATSLKLSLEWDETTYEEPTGRSNSIAGTTVFTLSK